MTRSSSFFNGVLQAHWPLDFFFLFTFPYDLVHSHGSVGRLNADDPQCIAPAWTSLISNLLY